MFTPRKLPSSHITNIFLSILIILLNATDFVYPLPSFDPTAILRNVLIPADAAVNSIIYRLRASDPDFDFPLQFAVEGDVGIAAVDSLNCSRLNSVCQANVILLRRLEAGRFYDFRVSVTTARRRRSAFMACSFRATNATTPYGEIFPGAPTLLMVSEKARRNMELGSLIVRGNNLAEKAALIEMWGSPQFGLRQRIVGQRDAEGTIILLGQLDYETRTVHHLTILANDPWTEADKDTRNIAAWPLLIAVLDEQDAPPVFTLAPPTTQLSPDLHPGDVILRVHAEDGDRGKPRDIRYGLVPEGNPFVQFFNLSEDTGELRLAKPVLDIQSISHTNIPIILTVVAEEVRQNAKETPAQSSTVKIALIPPPLTSPSPYFNKPQFETTLDENAPSGTQLDLDMELIGTTGTVYSIKLENSNGTFDVIPNVIEGRSKFVLKVRENSMLDYERHKELNCTIVAQELGEGNAFARASLIVNLKDINDNAPEFMQKHYHAEVLENAESGTTVVKVLATDKDRRSVNIRYSLENTNLFSIDEKAGVVTVKNSEALDTESGEDVSFLVVAKDIARGGKEGLTSTATITVSLLDVNDHEPVFEKSLYEFILDQSRKQFTVPAFITAIDKDRAPPNNEIFYELIGTVANLTIEPNTGELKLTGQWNYNEIVTLKARAYDNGVPRLWSECEIKFYPPENSKSYMMLFVVSGTNPNRKELEEYLSKLIGGRVVVNRLRPYKGNEPHVLDVSEQSGGEKSIAETTVTFESANSVLDVEKIREILRREENERSKLRVAATPLSNLWWLLLFILLLILLTCLIMVLCCVLEGCPLYVAPRKRRRRVSPVDIEKVVLVKDQLVGDVQSTPPPVHNIPPPPPPPPMENRSVQVAEWFGRREAWTPEHNEDEMDSIRRHEMDRGSERGRKREYYIREGGADILRLVTRGPATERPMTLLPEQSYVIDGKDILMRRYIDQQQQQQLQQNTLNRIQSEHELLEESLRQQNALLRQILMERERDLRLETQSLPAGTQTDQNVSTQTEFVYLRPPERQTRSDNDASSDDEEMTSRYNRKRRNTNKSVKRKIRTPIQEESEHENQSADQNRRKTSTSSQSKVTYNQTRTSILRQMKSDKLAKQSRTTSSRSLRKEVLQEISDSLNQSDSEEEAHIEEDVEREPDKQYTDSLEESSPTQYHQSSNERPQSGRRKSENDLALELDAPFTKPRDKSLSQQDLTRLSISRASNSSQRSRIPLRKKSSARYMEWYKPNTGRSTNSNSNKSKLPKPVMVKKTKDELKASATKVSKKTTQPEQQQMKNFELPTAPGPEHPRIQHSKNRFESAVGMPSTVKNSKETDAKQSKKKNVSGVANGTATKIGGGTVNGSAIGGGDGDVDSGIALTTRPAMAQKKSIFTIAYDDMATKQLPESISTTP